MKLNLSFLLLASGLCMISCGSDDDGPATDNSSCNIEVIEVTNNNTIDFTFTIKNGSSAITGVAADIKYFKDNVAIGGGIGSSPSNIDAGETFEFTTVTADITETSEFDCAEYVIKVFNTTAICEVKGPDCN